MKTANFVLIYFSLKDKGTKENLGVEKIQITQKQYEEQSGKNETFDEYVTYVLNQIVADFEQSFHSATILSIEQAETLKSKLEGI